MTKYGIEFGLWPTTQRSGLSGWHWEPNRGYDPFSAV